MTQFLSLVLPLLMIPLFSWAYLGEQTNQMAHMRVQNSPSAVTQMEEQTDSKGVVRHLHWKGTKRPNMREALGPCYEFYKSQMKTKARARGVAVISMENDQCKIQVSGGMGRARGEAHLK